MFKSASSNHSLWPEQARPRKTKQQLAFGIGAFFIGAVAAISAHNVLTELSTPAQEPVQPTSLAAAPIYATPGPVSAESAKATSASLAAAKLLSASTAPAVPSSATDGRGGATAAGSGEALATGAAAAIAAKAASSAPPVKASEIAKPADSSPAKAAEIAKPAVEPSTQAAEIAKPAVEPAAQPVETAAKPAAPERPKTVRRKRDPNYYARRNQQQIFPFFGFLSGFGPRG